MSRQKKPINEGQFRGACGIGCTLPEIAHIFDCHPNTIRRWCEAEYGESFESIYKEFSQETKISVRHSLFQLAKKNASVAIFLAKQYLGMSDNPLPEGETETLQAITRLSSLFDNARKRYDNGAASSPASEQVGAAHGSEGPPPAADAPRPVHKRKAVDSSAKDKAPSPKPKEVKSK